MFSLRTLSKIRTIYSGLAIYYRKGEEVKSGFVIGRSGNTGYSTAPHLHFAVKQNENYIDPIPFLENLKNFERK